MSGQGRRTDQVWNGGKWQVSTFRRQPPLFFGASCPARNRCFAFGGTFPGAINFAHPLIEAWNGRTWTIQNPVRTFVPHAGGVLFHVSCITQANCEGDGTRRHRDGSPTSPTT